MSWSVDTEKYNQVVKSMSESLLSFFRQTDLIQTLEHSERYNEHGAAYFLLSQIYQRKKNTTKAASYIDEAIQRNPFVETFYEQKASILYERKEFD